MKPSIYVDASCVSQKSVLNIDNLGTELLYLAVTVVRPEKSPIVLVLYIVDTSVRPENRDCTVGIALLVVSNSVFGKGKFCLSSFHYIIDEFVVCFLLVGKWRLITFSPELPPLLWWFMQLIS